MRIMFVAQSVFSQKGGIQRFNSRFIEALGRICDGHAGWKGLALIRSDQPADVPRCSDRLSVFAFSGAGGALVIKALFSCFSVDHVVLGHINLLPLGVAMKLINPSIRLHLVCHGIEVWGEKEFRSYKFWEPTALRLCVGGILSVSQYTANLLSRKTGFPARKITIFPNAIDLPARSVFSGKKRVADQLLTVTRLSRSERKKNVDAVIEAVSILKGMGVSVTLNIVGDGDLLGELREFAGLLGVQDSVVFHGKLSDAELISLYERSSVFVLPSEKEGFGIVYLEAWKYGLPVVAAKATAVSEVVTDQIDGILVDRVGGVDVASAINFLLKSPERGVAMAELGQSKILKKFNHEAFCVALDRYLVGSESCI